MLRCGIVGLPNVGKSTLFNALTEAGIEASNYPFCTIEPNIGVVTVPDERLDALAKIVKPQNVLPAVVQFVDIAGLVKGASKGEGLGNQFLANIRETDAIVHVVRCFENDDIVHVDGKVSPKDDIEVINTELMLQDMETLQKALIKIEKNVKSGNKDALFEKDTLIKVKAHLDAGFPVRTCDLSSKEQLIIKRLCLLTQKPVLYLANCNEHVSDNNELLQSVVEYAKQENAEVVPICAQIEADLVGLDVSERQEFMQELGMQEPGLHQVIRAAYKLLGLQTYFTAGVKEVRAWTIEIGALAPVAASVIHTDFEKGFIRAEVIAYDDFIQYKGEQGAKEAGKLRLEGKDYVVKDGDVMHFRVNT